MMKTEFVLNGEVAVVTVNGEGRVEIFREGSGVETLAPRHSFDSVVSNFRANGWTQKEDKVMTAAISQNIPVSIQTEVDEYLKLHEQKAALEKLLDARKKNIRNYMDNNDIKSIKGTNGKEVYLQDATASNSTATFSNYELAAVSEAVHNNKEIIDQVTEVRVNSDKLEALLKLGTLPEGTVDRVKKVKIVKPGTPRFSVKK